MADTNADPKCEEQGTDSKTPPPETARAPRPRSQSRARRRAFPGATVSRPIPDLPDEPLPAEAEAKPSPGVGPGAPIVLVPVGTVSPGVFEMLRGPIEDIFGRRTEVAECLPMPKYAFNPTREQYHSTSILKRVESAVEASWEAAVGITEADLFVPEVPFIYGEADRSTRSALISLRRLRPEGSPAFEPRRESLYKRFISEVIHHVGMLRGLAHCPNNRCVMFASETPHEIDKRGTTLCANCRKRLV